MLWCQSDRAIEVFGVRTSCAARGWQLTSPCAAPPPMVLPRRNAAHGDGAVLTQAKEAKYAELVAGNRCFVVVIALATGGRWSGEAVELIDVRARGKCSHSCGG